MQRQAQLAQGGLYVATGVWPLIDRRSFEAVTGEKTDWWLVNTVGALLAVAGAALIRGARRPSAEMRMLGGGFAAVLAAIDVVYASRGRISKIYLADAAAEAALVLAYAWPDAGRRAAVASRIWWVRRAEGVVHDEPIH